MAEDVARFVGSADLRVRLSELGQVQGAIGCEGHGLLKLADSLVRHSLQQIGPSTGRVSQREVRIVLEDAIDGAQAVVVSAGPEMRGRDIDAPVGQRVELVGAVLHDERLVVPFERGQHEAVVVVSLSAVRVELDRPLELLLRARPVVVAGDLEVPQYGVPFGEVVVDLEGPRDGHLRSSERLVGRDRTGHAESEIGVGEGDGGVCQRVVRVALDRLLEVLEALVHTFLGPPGEASPAEEKEVIGLDVVGRLLADPFPLLLGELRLERGRDLQRHVTLDREDVGQLAVVRVRPEMPVRLGVDELRHDPDSAPRAPHASLEQRRRVQDRADLAQALLAPLEPHHRAARDHLERADLGELRDHVLGDPIGEELVLRDRC